MKSKRLIYALQCPFTLDVHYIGKSSVGMIRPMNHFRKSHSLKIREWVENLKFLGYRPNIKILESVSETDDLDIRERFWIERYLNDGAVLLNSNLVSPTLITSKYDDILSDFSTNPMANIASFVKEKRKMIKISQVELAKKSGVGLRFLRDIEQGKRKTLRIDKIQTVLNMFGCTLDVVRKTSV